MNTSPTPPVSHEILLVECINNFIKIPVVSFKDKNSDTGRLIIKWSAYDGTVHLHVINKTIARLTFATIVGSS